MASKTPLEWSKAPESSTKPLFWKETLLPVVKTMYAIADQRNAVSFAITETKLNVLDEHVKLGEDGLVVLQEALVVALECARLEGEDDAIVTWIVSIFSRSLRFGPVKSP
jgi:hypothetical protein